MAISIKNEATERLARQVARAAGESLTEAIRKALEERWQRMRTKRCNRFLAHQIEELLHRVDGMPDLDQRSADEILGF